MEIGENVKREGDFRVTKEEHRIGRVTITGWQASVTLEVREVTKDFEKVVVESESEPPKGNAVAPEIGSECARAAAKVGTKKGRNVDQTPDLPQRNSHREETAQQQVGRLRGIEQI